MKAIVFDKCSPRTSDPGLLNFHFQMFHGVLDPERPADGPQAILRNAFQEAPVIMPSPMVLVWTGVYERMAGLVRGGALPVEDAFVYWVPYRIGAIPEALKNAAPRIEKDILRRDEKLLRRARSFEHSYVAVRDTAIKDIDPDQRVLATGIAPYLNYKESHSLVGDERLIDDLGIVGTAFGYQVSPAVSEVLKPLTPLPYFRWSEFEM